MRLKTAQERLQPIVDALENKTSVANLFKDLPKIKIGEVDGEKIFLSPPSWDCDWYWGFGYLGNKNCHYHVKSMEKDAHIFDSFKRHFGDSLIIKNSSDLWTITELFETFYTLKDSAELFNRGGSHYTINPCKGVILDKEISKRINEVILPNIFLEIYKILLKYD